MISDAYSEGGQIGTHSGRGYVNLCDESITHDQLDQPTSFPTLSAEQIKNIHIALF